MDKVRRVKLYLRDVLMALSIYITITILLLHFAYHVQKPLNFLQNALVFMVVAIITRQCVTVFALEWHLFNLPEDDWLFVCLILCRDVLTPMVTVLFANYYVQAKSLFYKIEAFLISLAIMLAMHGLALQFQILTYVKWNFFYTILLNAGFLLSALGVLRLVSFIQTLENRQNESL
ncbi:hypothetical protein LC048_00835 [Mesobacillus subterraneus]|uniref:hypothetical protein n=1 Tax=Mesobacillus subterraneus TaxID=285983 RepID=UPI001CFC833B|nr:hypothetical protein [Mesobacillus subterraneus]WLR55598.1 hypothetical protein LC048_00835 [Mesobacillus subterraneus]